MRKVLTDKTEAVEDIAYTADSSAQTVSGTIQKVLVDEDTKEEVKDGDPSEFSLTADEAATYFAASDAALQSILDARVPAASDTAAQQS